MSGHGSLMRPCTSLNDGCFAFFNSSKSIDSQVVMKAPLIFIRSIAIALSTKLRLETQSEIIWTS